jgi:hypothetical protein
VTPENLFIDTLEDLRRRTDLRASEYDMVQAAGLVRRLLIDGNPLYAPINRGFRLKLKFRWGRLRVATAARNGSAWVPGGWLDPTLADLHPSLQNDEAQKTLRENPPHEGTLHRFLDHDPILRGEDRVTVRELIKHYANREGGVHYDDSPPDSTLLDDVRAESEEALRLTVLAAGRIVYRGLEPLAAAVMLAERPGPFGLTTG